MIDHPAWQALQNHVVKNLAEYMTFLAALSIAWVCTIPEKVPASLQEWWTWMRNMFQTAVPAARSHNTPPPPVTENPLDLNSKK